jgi:hypothetical protein
MTFTLELLRRILKVFNPVNLDCNTYLKKKHPLFFICSQLKLLKMFLSMALKPPSQDQKA